MSMNSQNKNRKWWWIAGACLVLWYFMPGAVQSFREASAYQQRMQAMRAQAQSAGGTANTGTAIPSGPSGPSVPNASSPRYTMAGPAVPVSALAGIWSGNETQHTGDMCSLSLELRDKPDGMTAGYANMTCRLIVRPVGAPMPNANEIILKAMTPMAAILSGRMQDGAIAFHVDKAIGTPVDGCPFSALTVTPFGTQQIAVEWQRGNCDSGQMTMTRAAQ
jgi:hypothetical protein